MDHEPMLGLDSLYKMQTEHRGLYKAQGHLNGPLDGHVGSMDDLKSALTRQGVTIYPAKESAVKDLTAPPANLFGIKIYVDEKLPPNRLELRDKIGRVLYRFDL